MLVGVCLYPGNLDGRKVGPPARLPACLPACSRAGWPGWRLAGPGWPRLACWVCALPLEDGRLGHWSAARPAAGEVWQQGGAAPDVQAWALPQAVTNPLMARVLFSQPTVTRMFQTVDFVGVELHAKVGAGHS